MTVWASARVGGSGGGGAKICFEGEESKRVPGFSGAPCTVAPTAAPRHLGTQVPEGRDSTTRKGAFWKGGYMVWECVCERETDKQTDRQRQRESAVTRYCLRPHFFPINWRSPLPACLPPFFPEASRPALSLPLCCNHSPQGPPRCLCCPACGPHVRPALRQRDQTSELSDMVASRGTGSPAAWHSGMDFYSYAASVGRGQDAV